MEKTLKNILSTIIPVESWQADLLRNWPSIMGPLHNKVRLEKISEDTLIIGVYDSCWLQELYLLSSVLLDAINQNLDQPRIKQLRFKKVSATPSSNKQQKQVPAPRVLKPVTLKEHEIAALKNVNDPALGDALRQFLIRCYQEK